MRAAATLATRYLERRDRVGLVGVRRRAPLAPARHGHDAALPAHRDDARDGRRADVHVARRQPHPGPHPPAEGARPRTDAARRPAVHRGARGSPRARRFDVAVVEVDPVPLVEPGRSETDELAYRLWLLEREVAPRAARRARDRRRALGRRRARHGARGGEDIPAATPGSRASSDRCRQRGLPRRRRWRLPMARGERRRSGQSAFESAPSPSSRSSPRSCSAWAPLVPVAVALVGGLYAAELAIDDAPLDAPRRPSPPGCCSAPSSRTGRSRSDQRARGDAGDGLRRAAFVALLGVAGAPRRGACSSPLADVGARARARRRPPRSGRGRGALLAIVLVSRVADAGATSRGSCVPRPRGKSVSRSTPRRARADRTTHDRDARRADRAYDVATLTA